MNLVRVKEEGSHSRLAKVLIQGFPAEGIIDSGADITHEWRYAQEDFYCSASEEEGSKAS